MGLFDIFKKKEKKEAEQASTSAAGSEITLEDTIKLTQSLVGAYKEIKDSDCTKISFKDIDSLSGAVKELAPAIKAIGDLAFSKDTNVYQLIDKVSNGKWSDIVNSKPFEIAKQNDIGNLDLSSATTAISSIKAVNPYILMIAALLVTIEQEVVSIKETGDKILSFLQNDKAATVEGDLKTLNGILQGYKYNWEVEEYRASNHKLALDIKRTSEANIIFYKKQITDIVEKKGNKLFNSAVNKEALELSGYINYLSMSIYENAYASFVELLLLGTFNKGYIEMLKSSITANCDEYRALVELAESKSQNKIDSSFESKAKKSIASAVKSVGGVFSKKKDKDTEETEETPVTQEHIEMLKVAREVECTSIIHNIDTAENLFNNTAEICFDSENVYFIHK